MCCGECGCELKTPLFDNFKEMLNKGERTSLEIKEEHELLVAYVKYLLAGIDTEIRPSHIPFEHFRKLVIKDVPEYQRKNSQDKKAMSCNSNSN